MLKKFRSLFSQRNPVEFEVHRRPPADSELAPHALPASSEAPDEESTRARTLEALEQVLLPSLLNWVKHPVLALSDLVNLAPMSLPPW